MLTRFDPLRDMEQLFQTLGRPGGPMPMDAYRRGDDLILEVDLPGVDRDAIEVTAERHVLHIHARRDSRLRDDDTVFLAERPSGQVHRQVTVGDGFDLSRVDASYDAGVLRLRVPVAEEAKPRQIPVRLGGEAHAVEGQVSQPGASPQDVAAEAVSATA